MCKYRQSTKKNYYTIWKSFNEFYLKLDRKPDTWEHRINLFAAHLIHNNRKAATVKSYISAIKAVLSDINIVVNEDKYLLQSLTKACKLQNDQVTIRLPIHKDMLNLVLKTTY